MSDKVEVQTLDVLIDNLKMMRKTYGNLPLISSSDDEGNMTYYWNEIFK